MAQSILQVSPVTINGQQQHYGLPFPLVLQCQTLSADLDSALRWVEDRRDQLCAQATAHGAILFRGFPLETAEDFDRFVVALGLPNFPYDRSLSNAVRINRTARIFTANEAPATVTIFLHHEMAQTPIYPSMLLFFCEQPAEAGGATPLCRSDVLWERLEQRCPEFARHCAHKGLRYTNVMPSEDDPDSGMGRSWQSTLRATMREQAEQRLQELGYTWEWLHDGCLRATTPVLAAVRQLDSGRHSFFNQLIAAFQGWKDTRNDPVKAITFGDAAPLCANSVAIAASIAEELSFDVPWLRGDVALVDNYAVMHGRRTFSGTRKILASLIRT